MAEVIKCSFYRENGGDKVANKLGFKIICLNCGNTLMLEHEAVKVSDMRDIKVYQTQDIANIECVCGNDIVCDW